MQILTPWHRLFGIALTDLFAGRPWRVEVEKELTYKSPQEVRWPLADWRVTT